MIRMISNQENVLEDDIVLLSSSSFDKESHHIILSDSRIRFFNTHSLYPFVKEILRFILIRTLKHKCVYNRNFNDKQVDNKHDLLELIDLFACIRLQWFGCLECKLEYIELSVADVCNLFAYNMNENLISCIDLKVYNAEQDFRMFMCTKAGESRPLVENSILRNEIEVESRGSENKKNIETSSDPEHTTRSTTRQEDKLFDQIENIICDYMLDPDHPYLYCRLLRWFRHNDKNQFYIKFVVISPLHSEQKP
ncbi:unnamed protein product [Adineta ricciae]|uniref:Uncharacterized protein n=1 Tax=Adineta ricciae TaxID=249248 RepID=A0A815WDR6_ADIRI|nr:unnamed protein product [Adineta ricciae]CAF1553083.1 unnamed protein product [Adineta ricciae]